MAFLAHYSNSTIDFGLYRHIKSIPRGTGNLKCRPSTIPNHCALFSCGSYSFQRNQEKVLILKTYYIFAYLHIDTEGYFEALCPCVHLGLHSNSINTNCQ